MIFDILEQKIVDAGLGEAGQSLFRSFMPAETLVGVMTRIPLEGLPVDHHIPNRYKGRIQAIIRHTDVMLGWQLANSISSVLKVNSPENYPATAERGAASISIFVPETLPIQFPRLSGDCIEWSIHFHAVFAYENIQN